MLQTQREETRRSPHAKEEAEPVGPGASTRSSLLAALGPYGPLICSARDWFPPVSSCPKREPAADGRCAGGSGGSPPISSDLWRVNQQRSAPLPRDYLAPLPSAQQARPDLPSAHTLRSPLDSCGASSRRCRRICARRRQPARPESPRWRRVRRARESGHHHGAVSFATRRMRAAASAACRQPHLAAPAAAYGFSLPWGPRARRAELHQSTASATLVNKRRGVRGD